MEAVRGNRLETLYVVMLTLGLRRGEALGLKWTDFSAKKRILKVQRALKQENGKLVLGDVKNRTSRRDFNLPDDLVQSIDSHRTGRRRKRSTRVTSGRIADSCSRPRSALRVNRGT